MAQQSTTYRTAVYPGSFDPPTNGHIGMLKASLALCDRLIVAVGVHPAKKPMLDADRRIALITTVMQPLADETGTELVVAAFDNLVVDFARTNGATVLIRGLRDGTDLDYEMQMVGMNETMAPDLQTVFLPARTDDRHVSATLVRQIHALGGDITPFVPPAVASALAATAQSDPKT
ncbi:MAG: pantetheine-phosphate adenylyltransferase [Alphaproteobacteria bacterium]